MAKKKGEEVNNEGPDDLDFDEEPDFEDPEDFQDDVDDEGTFFFDTRIRNFSMAFTHNQTFGYVDFSLSIFLHISFYQ